ncbi:alpha/beta hydrolase family protein [Paraburkholderia sp. HD33-4]|uniref:alpha/beta hydrolase family protein n=1 Tax=Paraburkholderia sp. HD33-4 TaxID=2883242 RepID=UPI001F2564B4|nr:alpha/beta hydrolase [Paraburkholderia sp. HD33-4]
MRITRESERFAMVEALNGAFSSPEHCARVPNGLWIEAEGGGECIRYYARGFADGENPLALVYFSGDVILRTTKGVRHISHAYADASPMKIEKDLAAWSAEAQRPTIFLARPGIYGSSGDHNLRRRPREIELMNRALDVLKDHFKISSFILAGHSGGGQIAAALLNKRSDIEAGVFSSGLVSARQVSAYWEYRREIPGKLLDDTTTYYDPVDEIGNIRREPIPAIYVISDPEDRSVPFYSQLYYVRRLRSIGLNPRHIYAHAAPPLHHLLADHGKRAASLLAQGQSEKDVRRALQEIDLLQVKP